MRDLKKYVTIATLVISIFLIVGCGQNNSTADQANEELIKQREAQEQAVKNASATTTTIILPWKTLNASEADSLITSDKTVQIIDIREAYLYANKRIVGADLLSLDNFKANYTKIDKTKPVLLYDDNGSRSGQAAQILTDNGYTKVYTLKGGMQQWVFGVEP